jgi:hypothetical protein
MLKYKAAWRSVGLNILRLLVLWVQAPFKCKPLFRWTISLDLIISWTVVTHFLSPVLAALLYTYTWVSFIVKVEISTNVSSSEICLKLYKGTWRLHKIRCQVLCGSLKKLPRTSLQCCYIFASASGPLMPALLSVENWVSLKQVIGAWGCRTYSLSLMHILNQTESALLCNFVAINASEGSPFSIFYRK